MNKMAQSVSNVKLIITFFMLWATSFLSPKLEDYLAYFMILTVGLLHGSNDIKLLSKNYKSKRNKMFMILLLYIALILLTAVFFIQLPSLMLALFILFSAYHFGEQHFNKKIGTKSPLREFFFLAYGLTLFFMLFAFNSADTILIMDQIGFSGVTEVHFFLGLYLSLSATLFMGAILRLEKALDTNIVLELFLLLLFYLIFKLATLMWAFAIYFVIWHAYPSILDQMTYLKGRVNESGFIQYVKSSLLYWSVSVFGILLLFILTSRNTEIFNALFFTLIAAISFPHIFVMRKMNN
jgi:Brp/Blh family beta-carotene 15,15'-monooxygenase